MKFNLSLFMSVLLFAACTSKKEFNSKELNTALQLAGNNRSELEAVLKHYSDDEDGLKHRAAVYLISNMPGHYAKVYQDYKRFSPIFDSLERYNTMPPVSDFKRINDLFKEFRVRTAWLGIENTSGKFEQGAFEIRPDIETITADFLIENIDYAFKAWQLPWAKHLNFGQFCEYLLPYRYGYEPLQHWRKAYFNEFGWLADSLKRTSDPVSACRTMNEHFIKSYNTYPEFKNITNAIKPLDLLKGKAFGSCADQNGLAMLAMRSMGIPVCHLVVPQWGNRSLGHDLSAVLDKKGKLIPFMGAEQSPGGKVIRNKEPKIYLKSYAFEKSSLGYQTEDEGAIPPLLREKHYRDLTALFVPSVDIELTISHPLAQQNTMYTCVFNNSNWVPIASAKINTNKVVFKGLGRTIVYLPAYYRQGELIPAGHPFLIDSAGKKEDIILSNVTTETIRLNRKYPSNKRLIERSKTLIGGRFQGSNHPKFQNAVTLFTINETPPQYPVLKQTKPAKYKYLRFLFPRIDSLKSGISDLGFYTLHNGMLVRLKGKYLSSTSISEEEYEAMFGSNPSSYMGIVQYKAEMTGFDTHTTMLINKARADSLWVGISLDRAETIHAVGYNPRHDSNGIFKGQHYELLFWKQGWQSLGVKQAADSIINYNKVPHNALLLLKNIDHGVETRIFRYREGRQVWY